MELLVVSDTTEAQKPIPAFLPSFFNISSSYLGKFASKKLKVKNQGKWPAHVAAAAARAPW
jgi:hypothetical protein